MSFLILLFFLKFYKFIISTWISEEFCQNCYFGICVNTTVILDNGNKLTNLMNCDKSYPEIDIRFCAARFTYARPTVLGFIYLKLLYKIT